MNGLIGLISFASSLSNNEIKINRVINSLLTTKYRLDCEETMKTTELLWDGLHLKKIEMGNSIFKELGKEIRDLKMSYNLLTQCPNMQNNWEKVTKLYLNGNKLEKIEKSIFEMPSLNYLNLNDNLLESLPENIVFTIKFRTLYLKNNRLESLPKELSDSCIDSLCLDYNKFESLPRCVCKIPHLTYLSLDGNKGILDFPLEMGQMDPSKLKITLKDMDQVSDCYNYLIIFNIHYTLRELNFADF